MVLNLISSQLRKQFRAGGMASPKLSVLSTLSKKDIVDEIAETYDLPKAKSKRIVTTVLDTIVEVSKSIFPLACSDVLHIRLKTLSIFFLPGARRRPFCPA